MSRTYKDSPNNKRRPANDRPGKRRRLTVRAERRNPPDLRRLGRTVRDIAAAAQAEAEAEAAATNSAIEQQSEQPPEEPADEQ